MSYGEQERTNGLVDNGTDTDQVLQNALDERQRALEEQKKADDDRRVEVWYGIKPGEVPTEEQIHAMKDNLDINRQIEESQSERAIVEDRNETYYINGESPLFKEQQKQAELDEEKLRNSLEGIGIGSGPEGIQKIKDLIKDFNRPIEESKSDTDYLLTCDLIDRVVYGNYEIDYVPEKYGIQAAVDRALKPKTDQPQPSETDPTTENEIPTNAEPPVPETEEQPAVESGGVKTESPDPANSDDHNDKDDSQVLPPVLESEPATSPDKPEITYFDEPASTPDNAPEVYPTDGKPEMDAKEIDFVDDLLSAKSIDGIIQVVKEFNGPIVGSRKEYSIPEIIQLIDDARNDKTRINFITNKYNLRDAVSRVLDINQEQPPALDAGPEPSGEENPGLEVPADESAPVPEKPTSEVAPETEPSTEPAPFTWGGSSNGGVYDQENEGPYVPPEVSESTESNEDEEKTVEMPVADEAAEPTDNNDDPERGAPIDFKDLKTGKVKEGSKTTDSDYSEYSVGSAGGAIKEIPESETESDEDKIKLSFLERVKRAPHVLKDKIERLKSDGTFGEKVFWSGVGASAVILSGLVFQKYGIPIIHHGNEVTNAGSGASPDAVNAASTHVGDAVNVVSGSAEATGHANEALSHTETIKQGETIWGHVREALLRRDGKQPSNWQVLKDTLKTLKENELTLLDARKLANDTLVKIVLSAKK